MLECGYSVGLGLITGIAAYNIITVVQTLAGLREPFHEASE